ncbi:MAG: hypothetical protein LBE76_07395 [Nitrososphaerota archaeon]|jgi:hypothetical protein|nr:hypothetical protein [Nitrososphaerota archaeon]
MKCDYVSDKASSVSGFGGIDYNTGGSLAYCFGTYEHNKCLEELRSLFVSLFSCQYCLL